MHNPVDLVVEVPRPVVVEKSVQAITESTASMCMFSYTDIEYVCVYIHIMYIYIYRYLLYIAILGVCVYMYLCI